MSDTRDTRFHQIYVGGLLFSLGLALVGICFGDPSTILTGLNTIFTTQDVLISDYIAIGGMAAAFVNASLVTLISMVILWFSKDPLNGYTIVEIGLMSGFSFFGKNITNIWPIIIGTYLYAKVRREPFSKYASVSLLATALAPATSFLSLADGWGNPLVGITVGLVIGFVIPPLSAYTYKIQNGMNLYNMGFACGLLALILVPLMNSMGNSPTPVLFWSKGNNTTLGIILALMCLLFILIGFFGTKHPVWSVWAGYRKLLTTTGRAPSDYLRMFGAGPVLVNMGVNGLIATAYILLIGGDLNGPTLGGIFAVIGFSAFGKHVLNIAPVMIGVIIGGTVMHWSLDDPSVQLAGLFCTTLAPISGYFGWPFGILAGFLHSSVVLMTGGFIGGVNLYNNGFSGGLIAIVLYPIITAIAKGRNPSIQDEDYFDAFAYSAPISPDEGRRHKEDLDPTAPIPPTKPPKPDNPAPAQYHKR
ncbi:MAG: DUF1576 domain-containing protein [Oscillospiraceae bacterium]